MKNFFNNKWVKIIGGLLAIIIFIPALAIVWPLSTPETPKRPSGLLIKNTNIVDVRTGLITHAQDIYIADGEIASIGSNLLVDVDAVVDGSSQYAIPGLFDMHMHSYKMSPSLTHPLFVASGVTAVRDMGGCLGIADAWAACLEEKRSWHNAVLQGELVGPKYDHITSLQIDGGNAVPDGVDVRLGVGSVEGARMRLAFDKPRGTDFFKTYTMIPREGYFELAKLAQENDMYLAGHLPFKVTALEAVASGHKSLEHALLFIWECYPDISTVRAANEPFAQYDNALRARMIAEHDSEVCSDLFTAMAVGGTAFVPTHLTRKLDAFAINESFRSDERLKYIPSPLRTMWLQDADGMARKAGEGGQESYQAIYDLGLKLTGEAHRAGVTVMVGTDAPDSFVFPGLSIWDELNNLTTAGLSPIEALEAATIKPAKFLGLEGKAGEIVVGARADVVLLNYNPVNGLGTAGDIAGVINSGTYYDREALDQLLLVVEGNANSWTMWPKFAWQIYNSPLMLKQFAD